MVGFSPRYESALALAARAHRNQLRKGSDLPYIAHPVHVSVILMRHGFGEDLAIAGLLHDVVEDTDVPLAAIDADFGPEVARLVAAVSDPDALDGSNPPWAQRQALRLAHLRAGGPMVAALKAADAIHNINAILADLRAIGPAVWQRFNRTSAQTVTYYQAIQGAVRDLLGDHSIAVELGSLVGELERATGSA